MKHVNLDTHQESIKEFVQALAVGPGGTILEPNGRAIAWLLPVHAEGGNGDAKEEWTEEKNARRCALIDREIAGTLTAEEAQELHGLQQAMLRYRRRVAPLPLDEARALHRQLLAQARGRPGAGT